MEKRRTLTGKQKFLLKYTGPYLLILILPILIGYRTYRAGVTIVEADTFSIHSAMLQQTIESVENDLRELENLSVQVVSNSVLSNQAYSSSSGASLVMEFYRCIQELNKYMVSGATLEGSYIYYKDSDSIVNQNTLYHSKMFYQYVLQYDEAYYDDWLDLLLQKSVPGQLVDMDRFYSGGEHPYMVYATSIPFNINLEPQAVFIMYFRKSDLGGKFSTDEETAYHLIANAQGDVILSSPELDNKMAEMAVHQWDSGQRYTKMDFSGNPMICIVQTSNYNDWIYAYLKEEGVMFQNLNSYRFYFLSVFFLVILLGIAILIVISYRNTRPMMNIYEKLQAALEDDSSFRSSSNAYKIIDQSISRLIHSNEALQSGMQEHVPILQEAFMENLLRGLIYSEQKALSQTEYLGMPPISADGFFAVGLFQVHGGRDEDAASLSDIYLTRGQLTQMLGHSLRHIYFIHDVDYRTISVVFNSEGDKNQILREIRDDLEAFRQHTEGYLAAPYRIGVGDLYRKLSDIWYSFYQAMSSVTSYHGEERDILFYGDLPHYSESSYYSAEVKQHLENSVRSGAWENAMQLLDIIYNENFEKRLLSVQANQELFEQLKQTAAQLAEELKEPGIRQTLDLISGRNDPVQNFKYLKQTYKQIGMVMKAQKGKKQSISDEIRAYISQNYMLPDLNLAMAAVHFHFSEGYFSSIFKENMGTSFTEYVEQVRIQNASTLLLESQLNIGEIALLCGYNSAQSFRRAFKRVTGLRPTSLREE